MSRPAFDKRRVLWALQDAIAYVDSNLPTVDYTDEQRAIIKLNLIMAVRTLRQGEDVH